MAKGVEEQSYDAKPDFQWPIFFRMVIAFFHFRRWKRCSQAKDNDDSRNQRNELVNASPVILLPDQEYGYPRTDYSGNAEEPIRNYEHRCALFGFVGTGNDQRRASKSDGTTHSDKSHRSAD